MISLCIKSSNKNIIYQIFNELTKLKNPKTFFKIKNFKIFYNIIIHNKNENKKFFYNCLCKILTDIVIEYYEPIIIERLLNLNYFYFNDYDKQIIIDEFYLLKQKGLYNSSKVEKIIYSSLLDYLQNNNKIILSGFVNFRLKKYVDYLDKMMSEAVNQYLIDREYISFVNLLKNYVDTKRSKYGCVNLIYVNSKGILMSENGEIIELDTFNSSYISDISFSQNDYILNTLIGILPKKIVLHLISPSDQFIKTIEMIFSNKVQICKDCELCKNYKILQLT